MPVLDWNNDELRNQYEEDLFIHRKIKKNWTWSKKLQWFVGIIGFQACLVICFYGTVCFYIVKDAKEKKIAEEEAMKEVCIGFSQSKSTLQIEFVSECSICIGFSQSK